MGGAVRNYADRGKSARAVKNNNKNSRGINLLFLIYLFIYLLGWAGGAIPQERNFTESQHLLRRIVISIWGPAMLIILQLYCRNLL